MTEFSNAGSIRRRLKGPVLAAVALCVSPFAAADTVLLKASPIFSGVDSEVIAMNAPSAGTLTVTLSDLNFPDRLQDLSFSVTTTTGVLATLDGAGTLELELTGAGTYWAIISATGVGRFALGQASASAMFAPLNAVPLPGALLLLLSGLGGLATVRQRNRHVRRLV